MASDIKEFMVVCNRINSSSTFTSGDCVTGQVTFALDKDCKINSLSVKLKGKAEVRWNEYSIDKVKSLHSKVKYFSIKEAIIQKSHGNNIVSRGSKVYPFSLRIPAEDLPPSFIGKHGMIMYTLEANLSRTMKKDKKATAYLTLVRNEDPRSDPVLMIPQCKVSVKKMLFTSGTVSMDVYTERMAFYQGEGIKVVAAIQNKSTRDIWPKYRFYMKQSFFVKRKKKVCTQEIQREVGDAIPPSTSPTVTRILTIPPDTNATILNCAIIKVEYKVVIYLDIKYALDPEIKFPIVILPALKAEEQHHRPAYPVYGSGTSANSYAAGRTNFLQNSTASGPSAPPPSYGTYALYPSTNFRGKY